MHPCTHALFDGKCQVLGPLFPKTLQEPRECATLFLTTAIRARGPAATRHFATHEYRLPTLPMSPNHAERTAALPAHPCRIPLPAASVHLLHPSTCRTSAKALFAYVSDRLRSSGIVWDRPSAPPPFPQNCRNVRPIPPAKPAKERVNTRHFASKYAREKKASPRHLGVFDISKYWSANIQKLVNKCPKNGR